MSFKTRILVVSIVLVWLPLLLLGFFVRTEMSARLTAQYRNRAAAMVGVIEEDLIDRSSDIRTRLQGLAEEIRHDNRFRLLAVEGLAGERGYVLDYAGRSMRLLGLSMLQIQDERGRIVSSGHFRNEYDRTEEPLPRLLRNTPNQMALIRAREPGGPFLALAVMDSVWLGGSRFTLIGGTRVDESFLHRLGRGGELEVSLHYPGGEEVSSRTADVDTAWMSSSAAGGGGPWLDRWLDLPYIVTHKEGALLTARFVLRYPLRPLRATLRSLDLWLGGVLLAAVVGTLILLSWVASRVSRPLVELAQKTRAIDLQSLDTDFTTDREDEVGILSRFLASMIERLRSSVLRLREAERRATLGELARQVNHDIRNGLTPLRNALRHLGQVARDEPEHLSRVYGERAEGIDTSLAYLENLAANYARLSAPRQPEPCDLNRIVRELAEVRAGTTDLVWRVDLSDRPAWVFADPVALRRILENLAANAVEALRPEGGTIRLQTELATDSGEGGTVRFTVADDGPGISEDVRNRIFDDFYTTKAHGAGLGLSIVRRLVTDAQGTIQVESTVGKGTTIRIELPAYRVSDAEGERSSIREVGS